MSRPLAAVAAFAFTAALLAVACKPARPATPVAARDATLDVRDAPDDADAPADLPRDARRAVRPHTKIMATAIWTPVHSAPELRSKNIGYLRAGGTADVVEGPLNPEHCMHRRDPNGGWYRLRDGGFVCVGNAMATGWPNRDFLPPRQPDYDAGMPYPYAINYGMTVVYRRTPTRDDLRLYEPWRYNSTPDERFDNSEQDRPANAPVVRARPRTIDELRGPSQGPMVRRLLVGMYVALDRLVRNDDVGERYWHTQSGGYVRESRLSNVHDFPTSHGTALDDNVTLPYAFMIAEEGYNYNVSPGGGISTHHRVPKLTGVALADAPPLMVGGRYPYLRTADGMAVAARAVRHITRQTPPEGTGPAEKWIDVDLDEQILAAYEGPRPVYVALISSGRASDDREHNFETPSGSFRITSKHVTNTMDGETPNGVYSIEDVPWVMYFQQSYALHGAFWHHHFGWRMSHGCVNLSPPDARWLAYWSDPPLPYGWHGVYATPDRPGSRVVIRHSRANQHIDEDRPATVVANPTGN